MYQCINNATKWCMLKCKYNHKQAPFKGETSYVILRKKYILEFSFLFYARNCYKIHSKTNKPCVALTFKRTCRYLTLITFPILFLVPTNEVSG